MVDKVAIELHHGGFLNSEPPYKYEDRSIDIIIHVDPERISYWELIKLVVKLGYLATSKIYYKLLNKKVDDGLVLIVDDS